MKKGLTKLVALLLAAMLLGAAAGCSTTTDEPSAGTEQPANNNPANNNETSGGEPSVEPANPDEIVSARDSMVVGLYSEPTDFFPSICGESASAQLCVVFYEGLYELDKDGNAQPKLAESYEVSADGKTWTFKLKEGVKFHDGTEMTAEDVVYSLGLAQAGAKSSTYAGKIDVANSYAADKYTAVIQLTEPVATFLKNLCHYNCYISSKAWVEANPDDHNRIENGTGAFKLKEWSDGNYILVERFDDYHERPAYLEEITFRFISESNSRILELETGGVDVIIDVPSDYISQLEENPDITVYSRESTQIRYLCLNYLNPPYDNVKVREAIAHSVDMSLVTKTVFGSTAKTLVAYLPETIPGNIQYPAYEYNPELAKQLLAEAGYPDGLHIVVNFFTNAENRRMAEIMQNMMAEAGIEMEILEMDGAVNTPYLNAGKHEGALLMQTSSLQDCLENLQKFHSSKILEGGNRVNFQNAEVDELLAKAQATFDEAERIEICKQIQDICYENCAWVPICTPLLVNAANSKLMGYDLIWAATQQRYDDCYFVE